MLLCGTGFSAAERDSFRALIGPFPFGEMLLAETADFMVGVLVLLPALFPGRLDGFLGLDWIRARLSHGRAAIQRSIQLQPQLALPSSGGPRIELELALHCKIWMPAQWYWFSLQMRMSKSSGQY